MAQRTIISSAKNQLGQIKHEQPYVLMSATSYN